MQFIKDLGKILGIIIGITTFFIFIGWVIGAKSGKDKTEYYLYEHETASDFNEKDNISWNQEVNDSL